MCQDNNLAKQQTQSENKGRDLYGVINQSTPPETACIQVHNSTCLRNSKQLDLSSVAFKFIFKIKYRHTQLVTQSHTYDHTHNKQNIQYCPCRVVQTIIFYRKPNPSKYDAGARARDVQHLCVNTNVFQEVQIKF